MFMSKREYNKLPLGAIKVYLDLDLGNGNYAELVYTFTFLGINILDSHSWTANTRAVIKKRH